MSNLNTGFSIAVTAAMVAVAGTATVANAATADKTADKNADVHCYGINTCKGTSDCKSYGHECKGQNECKGQGFKAISTKACAKAGGKLTEK